MITEFKGEYSFLSNFHSSNIHWDGLWWPTVEHAFQAAKTNVTGEKLEIRNAPTPGKAKRLGRKISLREDWEEVKVDVMWQLLFLKFDLNDDLYHKLINTKNQNLIEGNWWHDNYWGDCYCPNCEHIEGQNRLGQLLEDIRSYLSH